MPNLDLSVAQLSQSLWDLLPGKACRVLGFLDTLDKSYCLRLKELGFHPGEIVSCLLAPRFGAPRLYCVRNTVYSLDDRVARMIKTSTEGV